MKRKTAAELLAELQADPDFNNRKKARDAAFLQREREHALAEAPIVEELRSVGVSVNSIWELVNSLNAYPQSLPILLKHLQGNYPDAVRDGIARAMAVPDAKFA